MPFLILETHSTHIKHSINSTKLYPKDGTEKKKLIRPLQAYRELYLCNEEEKRGEKKEEPHEKKI